MPLAGATPSLHSYGRAGGRVGVIHWSSPLPYRDTYSYTLSAALQRADRCVKGK
jgi:hypothetical protein